MPVTLKVCTSIVSISRRGGEEEIIFSRREGTYLTGRCSSSNSLGDWYEQYCSPTSVGFVFLPSLLLSFMTFPLLSQRKLGKPWTFFKMWYPDRARPRSAQVLLVSVSEGVRRTTSPRQVSTFPLGKYNFRWESCHDLPAEKTNPSSQNLARFPLRLRQDPAKIQVLILQGWLLT